MTMNEVQEKTNEYMQIALMASQYFQSNPEALRRVAEKLAEHAVKNQHAVFRTIEYDVSMFGITDPIGQITGLISKLLHDVASAVANAISGVLNGIKSAIQGAIDWLKNAVNAMTNLARSVETAANKFATTLTNTISNLISNIRTAIIKGLSTVATTVVSAVSNLFSTIQQYLQDLSSTLSDIVSGLSKLPSAVYSKFSDFISTVSDALSGISDAATKLLKYVSSIASDIANIVSKIPDNFSKLISGISSTVQSIFEKVKGIASDIASLVSKIPDNLSSAISSISDTVSDIVSKVSDIASSIASLVSKIPDNLSNLLKSISQSISNVLEKIKELPSTISDIISDIPDEVSKAISGISDTISSISQTLSSISSTLSNIGDTIGKGVGGVAQMVGNTVSGIARTVTDIGSTLASSASAAISTAGNMIGNAVGSAVKAASDTVSGVAKAAGNVVKVIVNVINTAGNTIGSAIGAGLDAASKALGGIGGTLSAAAQSIVSGASSALTSAAGFVGKIPGYVLNGLSGAWNWLSSATSTAWNWLSGVPGYISASLSNVWDWLSLIAGTVWSSARGLWNLIFGTSVNNNIVPVAFTLPQSKALFEAAYGKFDRESAKSDLLFQNVGNLGYIMSNTRYGYESLLQGVKDIKSYVNLMAPALTVDLGQFMRGDIRKTLFDTSTIKTETKWYTQQIKDHIVSLNQLLNTTSSSVDKVLASSDLVVEKLNNGQYILYDLNRGVTWLVRGTGELELINKAAIPLSLLQLNEKYSGILSNTSDLKSTLKDFAEKTGTKLEDFDKAIKDVKEKAEAIELIKSSLEDMQKSLPDQLKQADLRERFSLVQTKVSNQGTVLDSIYNAISSIGNMVTGGINGILSGIQNIGEYIWKTIPKFIKNFFDNINKLIKDVLDFVGDAAGSVVSFLSDLWDKLPDGVKNAISTVGTVLNTLYDITTGGISKVTDILKDSISSASSALTDLFKTVGSTLSSVLEGLVNTVLNLPKTLVSMAIGALSTIVGTITQIMTSVKTAFTQKSSKTKTSTVVQGLSVMSTLAPLGGITSSTTSAIGSLTTSGTGSKTASLPSAETTMSQLVNALSDVNTLLPANVIADIADKVGNNIEPLVNHMTKDNPDKSKKVKLETLVDPIGSIGAVAGQTIWTMISTFWPWLVISGLMTVLDEIDLSTSFGASGGIGLDLAKLRSKLLELIAKIKISKIFEPIKQIVSNVPLLAAFGIIDSYSKVVFKPYEYYSTAVVRAKYENKFNTEIQELLRGLGYTGTADVPFGSVSDEMIKRYALSTLAVSIGSSTELSQVVNNIKKASALMAEYMYLKGVPKGIVDWIMNKSNSSTTGSSSGSVTSNFTYFITFTDRFGKERVWLLSPPFELPTHSELLRMTQRDVLPNVQTMIKLGYIRGWVPDVTRALYLLTFKYPSFEKLWKFYMRATAGMLWFSPPSKIVTMFSNEAKALGAGAPITPYQIQQKLGDNPGAMSAFEMALNTYFKWIEYSNFSWFTQNTTINGVNIGSIIYNNLGGWTADSWIMADVAADIPGKVDFRWMSRFGIFMWLAEKLGSISGYKPLVDTIPSLLEDSASSTITVDLSWFSKFLQGTGLHPAWVPLTTVAENIMVISDEMTLLRTGWLNLYRYGFVTPDFVETALSGLFTVSYKVGYWDPSSKTWTTGWINLPVRWLPHERKLLQLRMAIDRVVDLYRSFMSVMRRAIQYKAIKTKCKEGSTNDICYYYNQMYSKLKSMFADDTKKILGQAIDLPIDQNYFEYLKSIVELEGDIAINIEKKLWWFRLSGWLLYYGARGYITSEDLEKIVDKVKDNFALSDSEANAYKDLAKSLNAVIIRTQLPTPNEIATIAEYWPDATKYEIDITDENGKTVKYSLIDFVLKMRGIPDYLWDFWKKVAELKPLKNDVDRLFTQIVHSYQYDYIMQAFAEQVTDFVKDHGYSDLEISIGKMTGYLMRAHREITRYIPTPTHFATIAEIVPEVLDEQWSSYKENITVYTFDENNNIVQKQISVNSTLMDDVLRSSFMPSKWIDVWKKYIQRRPYMDDVRRVVTALLELGYQAPALFDAVKDQFFGSNTEQSSTTIKDFGYDDKEISILMTYKDLRSIITGFTRGVNTYSELARIAEIVPEVLSMSYSENMTINVFGETKSITISGSAISDVIDSLKIPEEWKKVLKKYVYRAPIRDEVRRYANEVISAVYSSVIPIDLFDNFADTLENAGYSQNERTILKVVAKLHKARREWTALGASLAELATIAELEPDVLTATISTTISYPAISITQNDDGSITIDETTVQETFNGTYLDLWLRPKYVPSEWVDLIKDYLYRRTIRDEVRRAVTSILTAYQFSITTDSWFNSIFNNIVTLGYDSNEHALLKFSGEIRRMDREWRIAAPSVNELAVIAEYVPEMFNTYEFIWKLPILKVVKKGPGQYTVTIDYMEQKFKGSMVDFFLNMTYMPQEWIDLLKKYIYRRQFRDDVARLVRAAYSAVRYGVPESWVSQYVPDLSQYGISQEELDLIDKAAHIEYYADIMRYVKSRVVADSVPRITLLASMAQYVEVPETVINSAIDYDIVSKLGTGDFIELLKQYIKVRPLKPEARRVLSAMAQALRYGIITKDQLNAFVQDLKNYGFTSEEINLVTRWADLEAQIAEVRHLRMEYMPNPRTIATLAEYVSVPQNLVEESFRRYMVPDEWKDLWLQYIKVRPIADEVRRLITAAITAYAYGAISDAELSSILNSAKSYGYSAEEIGMLQQIAYLRKKYVEVRLEAREYVPTPITLANIAEIIPSAVNYLQSVFEARNVPPEWQPLWSLYVQVKPIANDVNTLATAYFRAKARGVSLGDLEAQILNILKQYGWTDRELQIRELAVRINQMIEASREYIPTPAQLATIAEYVPRVATLAEEVFKARNVPPEWQNVWIQYIRIRPTANEIRSLITSAITAYAYSAITKDELAQLFNSIKQFGYTDQEIAVLQQIADLRRKYVEARLEAREYIPTPITIATMAEYLPEAVNYLQQVFEHRNVPPEWRPLWEKYVQVRPVYNDVNRIATAYFRALARGIYLGDLEATILSTLRQYGWTDQEIELRKLASQIEELIYESREYIPTPSQLATIAEVVPEARQLLPVVLQARRVPQAFAEIWQRYVDLRPLQNEVNRLISSMLLVYEHLMIDKNTLQQLLNRLQQFGLEDTEIQLLVQAATLRRHTRMYDELVGTPRSLVSMAEYSPTARNVALAKVHAMIDELPIDDQSKQLLKTMWEEYIRIRPVYDEVRRYVTELINDYANGVIDDNTLVQELNDLKQWGLDDYEIQFYIWLAQKRRLRVLATRGY